MLNNIAMQMLQKMPQFQQYQPLIQTLQNSANPMAILQQKFGNNPAFQKAMKAVQGKNPQEIEQYVKNTFFASNKLAAGTAEKQNDIYLYKITITDKSGEKAESVNKTFVMQLKEGTDFVMSFNK